MLFINPVYTFLILNTPFFRKNFIDILAMKAKTNTKNSKYVWVTQRVQGVVPQEDLELTYTWNSLLENIMTNPGDELDDARVLDVRSFYGPPLNRWC